VSTTPLWVPLVVAGFGVSGVLFTQWRSDVRERIRSAGEERREEKRTAREVDRDRDARLFEHRRVVFASIVEHYHRWASIATDVEQRRKPEPPEDAMDDFWERVAEVELYGGDDAASAAINLYWSLHKWVYGVGGDEPSWEAHGQYLEFVEIARAELGVPASTKPKPAAKDWWKGELNISEPDPGPPG
jgi:hypothetical protein